jgi:predicted transcriptional regulator of viral defense system
MKYKIENLGGLSSRERNLLGTLRRDGVTIVDNKTLISRFSLSQPSANQTLLRLEQKGWLHRVQRGVYVIVDISSVSPKNSLEEPMVIAMDLFQPCYLGGWTAAEHWGLTEQIFNTILIYSTSYQRISEKVVGGVKFVVCRIQKKNFFGTEIEWSSNHKLEFSDRHRTILDILNNPENGGGAIHTIEICKSYFTSAKANSEVLISYATRISKGAIFKRLGFLAERLTPKNKKLISFCLQNITKGISRFDPTGPKKGAISTKWNLQLNIPLGDLE